MKEMNFKEVMTVTNFASDIMRFGGLMESLNVKIKKYLRSELDTALDLLINQKTNDAMLNQMILRKARLGFTKALYLETKKDRLVAAYIGLAFCHIYLNDIKNHQSTLHKLINADFWSEFRNKKKYQMYFALREQVQQYLEDEQ